MFQFPKLPTFTTKLPSTGKDVSFRPITLKEESFLLLAKESKESKEILDSVKEIIKNCVDVKPNNLTDLDLEWLFLQIRIKSVSEEVELHYRCMKETAEGKKCGAQIISYIDLNNVKIVGNVENTISIDFINGTYKITIKKPKATEKIEKDKAKQIYQMIVKIEDGSGNVILKNDLSYEQFEEFISTFTHAQLAELEKGISEVASLYYKNEIVCPVCGNKTIMEYKNLYDFFS